MSHGPIIERLTPLTSANTGILLNNATSDTYYAKLDGRQNYRVYAIWTAGGAVNVNMSVKPVLTTSAPGLGDSGLSQVAIAAATQKLTIGTHFAVGGWPATTGADTAMVFPNDGLHDPSDAASGFCAVYVNTPVSEISIEFRNETATAARIHLFVEKI
jgi:hypothetical protein